MEVESTQVNLKAKFEKIFKNIGLNISNFAKHFLRSH